MIKNFINLKKEKLTLINVNILNFGLILNRDGQNDYGKIKTHQELLLNIYIS